MMSCSWLVHKKEQKSERRKRLQKVVFVENEKNGWEIPVGSLAEDKNTVTRVEVGQSTGCYQGSLPYKL